MPRIMGVLAPPPLASLPAPKLPRALLYLSEYDERGLRSCSFTALDSCQCLDSGGAGDLGGAFDLGCERGGTYKVSRALDKADPLTSAVKTVSACQRLSAAVRPVRGWLSMYMYLFRIHHPSAAVSYTHLTLPTTPYV